MDQLLSLIYQNVVNLFQTKICSKQMNERERRLDVGLLQSGKFAEALAGLEKWLADTEDMVNNQKPPSADYKVVKAQLQEQKVILYLFLVIVPRVFDWAR